MAAKKNPWATFWRKHRQRFNSFDISMIDKPERDGLLLAHDVLKSVSADWMAVWRRQNPAYWILARLGAIEVRGTFHWDKHKPRRKPGSLIIAAEFTGDFMPEEIHQKALAAGMVPQNLQSIDRAAVSVGRFAHAVRHGPFASGLLSLPQDQFVVVAERICAGQPELPADVARVTFLRSFVDGCCPVDGLLYETDEPEVFFVPRSTDPEETTEEYRSPEEWCWIFSELPKQDGVPLSPRTFSRWVANGMIKFTRRSRRQLAARLDSLPVTMRNSRAARDAIVAKFHTPNILPSK